MICGRERVKNRATQPKRNEQKDEMVSIVWKTKRNSNPLLRAQGKMDFERKHRLFDVVWKNTIVPFDHRHLVVPKCPPINSIPCCRRRRCCCVNSICFVFDFLTMQSSRESWVAGEVENEWASHCIASTRYPIHLSIQT